MERKSLYDLGVLENMSVSNQQATDSRTKSGLPKRLLTVSRDSLYRIIRRELIFFIALFAVISTIFQVIPYQLRWELSRVFKFFENYLHRMPASSIIIIVGFYVMYVAYQWWKKYETIPSTEKVMHLVTIYVKGETDLEKTVVQKTLTRYLNLSLSLASRTVSAAVKRRFPTLNDLVASGFMTYDEKKLIESVSHLDHNDYLAPCAWFINLLRKQAFDGCDESFHVIVKELIDFRSKCTKFIVLNHGRILIPLIFTQVATLCTYSYSIACILGRQQNGIVEIGKTPVFELIEAFVPLKTILELLIVVGFLKVAEKMINPFDDEEDIFGLNLLIDHNVQVSYLSIESLMKQCPSLSVKSTVDPFLKSKINTTSDRKIDTIIPTLDYQA